MPKQTIVPISFFSVVNKTPDRSLYIRIKEKKLRQFLFTTATILYNALKTTFTFDQLSTYDFHKYIWPAVASGAAVLVGEFVTQELQTSFEQDEEVILMTRFLTGLMILSYSAMHRVTEQRPKTIAELSKVVASEVMAITFLYTSVCNGSQLLLQPYLSEGYRLIGGLSLSSLAVPGALTYLVHKYQEFNIKEAYENGAQRSDTALMSSGATRLANTFFQTNHFMLTELVTLSRLFQLGLIADNILHAPRLLDQFRNFPALLADVSPAVLKNLLIQKIKIEADYQHNTTKQKVLRWVKNGYQIFHIERSQLQNGDLVSCDENFSFESVPVSGEVMCLQKQGDNYQPQSQKISFNLKAHNGEDVWIECITSNTVPSADTKVDLQKIHAGKHAAVLAGSKLNLYGGKDFYICIQAQKERTFSSGYVKQSVINHIVSDYKKRLVMIAMLFSGVVAGIQSSDLSSYSTNLLRLLFNLSQMLIPFAETFLREMINGRLLKQINQKLELPIATIDALRIVDFINAVSGYYKNRFSEGVTIISDKTGTLTTSKMHILGYWTTSMPSKVSTLLQQDALLVPSVQDGCFEIFAYAFTNSQKEIEPEELAILEMFKSSLVLNDNCLKIDILGNNHFRKTIQLASEEKIVETFHLGLYRALGGRFTIVQDGNQYYIVFCGIPRGDAFYGSALLRDYSTMEIRTGVLSRDWCIARHFLTAEHFYALKELFDSDKKSEIEKYLSEPKNQMLTSLQHIGTFLIDNPIKHGVEHFIAECRKINVPVFIATGDTIKSAENIAKVLCKEFSKHIISIRDTEVEQWLGKDFLPETTIIFSGFNKKGVQLLQQLLQIDIKLRPFIIFSEMTTEKKGELAKFLKDSGFFVVANGDGSNDVAMMRHANMVIAHLTDEGKYAPQVEQFADLNDKQLQQLLNSDRSFYELFNIKDSASNFIRKFAPLANSQEKPSIALLLKSSKMSFELARSMGYVVKDIPGLHWWGVAFDLSWLWLAFDSINATTDLPMDNQSLDNSNFPNYCLLFSMLFAISSSIMIYQNSGESTNLTWMLMVLSLLPIVLRSIFSGYSHIKEEIDTTTQIEEIIDESHNLTL